ncbi:uncharacterized protein VP01_6585g1 [Puccinia sorghi]|uniref:Uncharacterized protein n=1 Tax=Puccinia sorghi TaxID=27349 RepID=A0A0L6UFC7_9BASI|nr:uncharacterized protein VP01_6585g1 [Puccinia sorghi]
MASSNPSNVSTTKSNSDINPKAKFLSEPTKYKDSIEATPSVSGVSTQSNPPSNSRVSGHVSRGRPGAPSAEEILAAVNNIKRGNNPPRAHLLARASNCTYRSRTGHWRSNCSVLQHDAFLPLF